MAETIQIESEDPVEQKYEIIGKILQSQKEGLARLEREEPAKERRRKSADDTNKNAKEEK